MGLIIPLKSEKSVQVQKLTMTNPRKLLQSRSGEIPFNDEIGWNDSLSSTLSIFSQCDTPVESLHERYR